MEMGTEMEMAGDEQNSIMFWSAKSSTFTGWM